MIVLKPFSGGGQEFPELSFRDEPLEPPPRDPEDPDELPLEVLCFATVCTEDCAQGVLFTCLTAGGGGHSCFLFGSNLSAAC